MKTTTKTAALKPAAKVPATKPAVTTKDGCPTPDEVKAARARSGLTQQAAATLVHSKLRSWQEWEQGHSTMHAGLFELFNIKYRLLQTMEKHTKPAAKKPT